MFARTSDHFTACVVIYPDGKTRKANILHVRLHSKDRALAELEAGHVAWVKPDDADEILEKMKR